MHLPLAQGAFCRAIRLAAGLLLCMTAATPVRAGSPDWKLLNRTNLLEAVSKGHVIPVRSTDAWEVRRASIIAAMEEVMGPLPGPEKRCPLDVRIEQETDLGNYVRRFISYASEPNGRVPAYLLIPKSALTTKRPVGGVLALHQTHPLGQKVVVGLGNSTNDEYGVS